MTSKKLYNPETKVWSGLPLEPLYNVEGNLGCTILRRLIQKPADICQISDDTGVKLTNSEMYKRALQLTEHLKELDVKQHDVIGLMAMNSENVVPLLIAGFVTGAAVSPLMIAMGVEEVESNWSQTKPKAVFCDSPVLPVVQKALENSKLSPKIYTMDKKVENFEFVGDVLVDDFVVGDYRYPILPDISTTTALIMCSSGTTRAPKGVRISHKQILSSMYVYSERNTTSNDIALISFTTYWISYPLTLCCCLLYGMQVLITSKVTTPDLWMDLIDKHKVTFSVTIPQFVVMMLKSSKLRKLESLHTLVLCGSTFSVELLDSLKAIVPNGNLYIAYGCTENVLIACGCNSNGNSSGYPAYNLKIKIIDPSGNSLGPNESGEICFQSPWPFATYVSDDCTINSEDKDCVIDKDNFMRTGDVGYFDDDGYIYITDRIKHLIKTKSSYRISPSEIEKVINGIKGVAQSCVVGVTDPKFFYDVIYAFVIKDKNLTDLTEDFIVNYVNSRVISEKLITGGVIFVDSFPMTSSWKIMNRKLREQAAEVHKMKLINGKNCV